MAVPRILRARDRLTASRAPRYPARMHDRTTSAAFCALLLASLLSACGQAKAPARGAEGDVAAQIGAGKVTMAEVDERASGSLARIEFDRYQARRRALDEIVSERLVEEAAKARGLSKE